MSLSAVRIVLVEPAGALNVGSVARIMKNMGLQQLVLVNPQCDPNGNAARQMAVHAQDLLAAAQQVSTLPEALVGCQRAVATTGLDRTTLQVNLELPSVVLPWLLPNIPESSTMPSAQFASALIFGREDHGLTRAELNYAQRFIRIPTSLAYSSLNLAQAVAICCYELAEAARRQAGSSQNFEHSGDAPIRSDNANITKMDSAANSAANSAADLTADLATDPATLDSLEGYYQHLEKLLLKIGYLYPHTANSRMEKLRRLYSRAELSQSELAMLRGILSQVEWALGQKGE